MLDTLFLMLPGAEWEVRGGRGIAGEGGARESLLSGRFKDGSEELVTEGGVSEPVVGAVPWLPPASLDVSVETSVRKLALDRRLNSLKLNREGAMAGPKEFELKTALLPFCTSIEGDSTRRPASYS